MITFMHFNQHILISFNFLKRLFNSYHPRWQHILMISYLLVCIFHYLPVYDCQNHTTMGCLSRFNFDFLKCKIDFKALYNFSFPFWFQNYVPSFRTCSGQINLSVSIKVLMYWNCLLTPSLLLWMSNPFLSPLTKV